MQPFSLYQEEVASVLKMLCRLLRIAYVLSIRRKNNLLPAIELEMDGDGITLRFPDGWLKSHPLLDAELANERWLQHRVGWNLAIE